jgi:type IV secretion system protein VirB2
MTKKDRRVTQSKASEQSPATADEVYVLYIKFLLPIIIGLAVFGAGHAMAYGGSGPGSGGTPMADVLCLIVDWFSGNLGRGLATIGVSAVAIGAIFGKVSWGLALTVMVGVAVMFGASDILFQLRIIRTSVC